MRPRKILRIAWWEVTKSAGTVNRFTVATVLVGAVLAAAVGPSVVAGGVDLDRGIYRVHVDDDSRYAPVVEENSQFAVVEDADSADVVLAGGTVVYDRSDRKSRAAAAEFRDAVQRYNDRELRREDNQSAAFPVNVSLVYQSRGGDLGGATVDEGTAGGAGGDGAGTDGDADGDGAGGGTATDSSDGAGDGGDGTDGGGGDGTTAGGADGDGGDGTAADGTSGDAGGGAPDVGGRSAGGGLFGGTSQGSPSDIEPPFPFGSLVLAFVFVVPMNFVIQAYGSSIMEERLNRRGELLLVSPVSPKEIVAGKTLPYLGALCAVEAAITVAIHEGQVGIDQGLLSFLAIVPVVLMFLAFTFVAGMFARSFKELSFVTVSLSVTLTAYVFVPAIFTEITPIALISPLTVVVRDLEGLATTAPQFLFSTGPFLASSAVLFALGTGIYREEDMFTQRPVPLKALDAVASRIAGKRSILFLPILLMPFVIVAELLLVASLFALQGLDVTVVILLLGIAVVEELAKGVGAFAGYADDAFDRSAKTALVLGALSGLGFFLGEKLLLVVQVVGLQSVDIGSDAFPAAQQVDPATAAVLLLAPLALHVVTAAVSTLGARRGTRAWAGGLVLAVLIHLAYNLGVITYVA
jgi:ABC-type Na+ efflux pump permease subunit